MYTTEYLKSYSSPGGGRQRGGRPANLRQPRGSSWLGPFLVFTPLTNMGKMAFFCPSFKHNWSCEYNKPKASRAHINHRERTSQKTWKIKKGNTSSLKKVPKEFIKISCRIAGVTSFPSGQTVSIFVFLCHILRRQVVLSHKIVVTHSLDVFKYLKCTRCLTRAQLQ